MKTPDLLTFNISIIKKDLNCNEDLKNIYLSAEGTFYSNLFIVEV